MSWLSWPFSSGGGDGDSSSLKKSEENSNASSNKGISLLPPAESHGKSTVAVGENATEDAPFEIAIIDESGEGFGFDLNPATVMRPLAVTSGVLFGLGALVGVPFGLAMGRSTEDKKSVKPTMGGFLFAFRAFAYGTLLCGAFGAASAYATARYYDVSSWEEFGVVMREVVPARRQQIESSVSPVLSSVRSGASNGLPGPTARARDWFGDSRLGIYIRSQIEEATTVDECEEHKP